jgi:hypothetical protein
MWSLRVGRGVGGTLSVMCCFHFDLKDSLTLSNGCMERLVTGCIDPSALDRINPDDDGGQYDSSGGSEGTGNPVGSVCEG